MPSASADLPSRVLRLSDLRNRSETEFSLTPTAEERVAVAEALGVQAVRKLTFAGRIAPQGEADWRLTADLGATAVQACVATLEPVTTRIDEPVTRTYARDFAFPEGGAETEMPEDDTLEPLPATIDLGTVMIEALSLALPAFPRADGAEVGQVLAAGDGIEPLTDEATKPFAGLSALRDRMGKDD